MLRVDGSLSDYSITCVVENANENTAITWFKDGTELGGSTQHHSAYWKKTTGILKVSNVVEGLYTCQVKMDSDATQEDFKVFQVDLFGKVEQLISGYVYEFSHKHSWGVDTTRCLLFSEFDEKNVKIDAAESGGSAVTITCSVTGVNHTLGPFRLEWYGKTHIQMKTNNSITYSHSGGGKTYWCQVKTGTGVGSTKFQISGYSK